MTRDEFDARLKHSMRTPQPGRKLYVAVYRYTKYYRSLVKTAMAMAFSAGISPADCGKAVRYLRDESIGEEGVVTLTWHLFRGLPQTIGPSPCGHNLRTSLMIEC